jgi:hypothetical protein
MDLQPPGRTRLHLAVACAVFAVAACGPIGPIPGGKLEGEVVAEPVEDWSFTNPHETVQLETRLEDPHSVTVWCVAQEGRLYIPSRHPEKKRWVQYVAEDARVRVGVDDRIYPARIARVTDRAELEAVVPLLIRKYELDPPDAEEEKDVWVFRVESPQASIN